MAYITLDQAKKHLNIESGFTDDDTYITSLIDVAELAVEQFCNDGLSGYTAETMPVTVSQATLLLIAHYYVSRQIVAYGTPMEIPYAFRFLLDFYRVRTVV
jgi:uncharacterized phage protein (predicted DNA packaging)